MSDLTFTDRSTVELTSVSAGDLDVVNAARISLDDEHLDLTDGDEGLIRSLIRNGHSSPFRHNLFKFRVSTPIFVAREHLRHSVGHTYNEMSGRYTELEPKFWLPNNARVQIGGAMSYDYGEARADHPLTELVRSGLQQSATAAWNVYQNLLDAGVAREQARAVLPVGVFTKYIWTCNAHSLMHFLELRSAPDAQKEIRDVAAQAEKALALHMPITYDAFVQNGRKAP